MRVEKALECDVFVVGAGIAGVMAALEAASHKKRVILSSSHHIFSGASFYPGTWGLGLITPENEQDEEDLIQMILSVGCGMAKEDLVRSFVKDLIPTVKFLEELNVELLYAKDKGQKEFIPCFDHKTRGWHGVVAKQARKRLRQLLEELGVSLLPKTELIDVIEEEGKISGALVCEEQERLKYIKAQAVVLATGGYGGLFERRLTTSDITGMGHYIALQHGCTLVNLEFMQMMPALLDSEDMRGKAPIIFNEKTFRFATLLESKNEIIPIEQNLLEQRAAYGPFTARLDSKVIDFEIAKHGKKGVKIRYGKELYENMPEFIKTYFDWLEKRRNKPIEEEFTIGMFAHAANGGVEIKEDAATALKGFFACGEVTGGMHGADRIGGLSSANGFVFGRRAGRSASQYIDQNKGQLSASKEKESVEVHMWEIVEREVITKTLQKVMMESAMVIRSEECLSKAITQLTTLKQQSAKKATTSVKDYVASKRTFAGLQLALAILQAQRLRKESRGSHYRIDYKTSNPNYEKRIVVQLKEEAIVLGFESTNFREK